MRDSIFYNPPTIEIFNKDADFTLNEGDHINSIVVNNGLAVNCIVPDGLRVGFSCTIIQVGIGEVNIIPDNNGQINDGVTPAKTNGAYTWAKILCIAPDVYTVESSASGSGGNTGIVKIKSQFNNNFALAVDEEVNNLNVPQGTGSLTITKVP